MIAAGSRVMVRDQTWQVIDVERHAMGGRAVRRQSSRDPAREPRDPAAIPLVKAAAAEGWTEFVVGYSAEEQDDTPIEVAWPDCKVGILPSGTGRPSTLDDWDLRVPDAWTTHELLDALTQGAG